MQRYWGVVGIFLAVAGGVWAAPVTIHYREPTASGTLQKCYVLYCTSTATCTPNRPLAGSDTASDDGNGGDDHASGGSCSGGCEYAPLTLNVPIKNGETHACFQVVCTETNKNETANSTTTLCCTGGVCS